MNSNDPMTIKNTTGVSSGVYNAPMNDYSSLSGARVLDPENNYLTPGRVNQNQQSQSSLGINSGYDKVGEQAAFLKQVFGMNVKSLLTYGDGIDPSLGNHVIGSVTQNIPTGDGGYDPVYIRLGANCNFCC